MCLETHNNVIKCCYNCLCCENKRPRKQKNVALQQKKETLLKNKHLTHKNFKWYLINSHVKSFN